MAEYKAPLRDMRFVLNEVFEADKLWSSLAGLEGAVDVETAEAILEECGKIASQVLAAPGPCRRKRMQTWLNL